LKAANVDEMIRAGLTVDDIKNLCESDAMEDNRILFRDLWKVIRPIGKYTPEFLMGSIFSIGALNSQQVSILWKI